MEVPDKIYIQSFYSNEEDANYFDDVWTEEPELGQENIEYTRTDAFIEKALKWYCRDCECNDNCPANSKCAFWSFFKMYLGGAEGALPPKIENALDPEGFTTESYRRRHLNSKLQSDFVEKEIDNWFNANGIPATADALKETALHFVELGLNLQRSISIDVTNIDKIIEENGVDPNSKEAKMFKESYYIALEKLKA